MPKLKIFIRGRADTIKPGPELEVDRIPISGEAFITRGDVEEELYKVSSVLWRPSNNLFIVIVDSLLDNQGHQITVTDDDAEKIVRKWVRG